MPTFVTIHSSQIGIELQTPLKTGAEMECAAPYRPYPLLRSGHLQTLMIGLLSGARAAYRALPHRVALTDGEALLVHEEQAPESHLRQLPDDAPIAILIHGLGGDHTSPYLQRIAGQLFEQGIRAWRVDLRGSGHGLELAWRPAHAGCSGDLVAIVNTAHRLYPAATIHIAGFSLSGNILLKMLGEVASGEQAIEFPLDAIGSAIAIAPPVDLQSCANNMDRLSRRIYTGYYLRNLAKQVQIRCQHWEQWRQVQHSPRVRTIQQFDARYTAPLAGFRDTEHYYASSSSLPWLPKIATRTLIVADRHDPIVAFDSFAQAQPNPARTRIMTTNFGGHMGYFGIDAKGKLIRWMEYFVVQQLARAALG